jgi:trimeric autotransporter adhesin
MKKIIQLFVFCFISFNNVSTAQCNTNNTICTQGIAGPYTFALAGNDPNDCLGWLTTSQFAYIVLYITTTGPLNLLIDGDATDGFLDVSIYNIPSGQVPCNSLIPANLIGCNYAIAADGCNEFGNFFGCSSSVPAPNVVAGQQLMIIVEDYGDGASNNFTLQLAPLPAAQTGPPNPAITPVGPFCQSNASVQLNAASMGGTWTGPGVSATGLFNPATAGAGTHTINYAIGQAPCNSASSTTITVKPNPTATVNNVSTCQGQSATLTATTSLPGGTFVWTPSGNGTAASINVTPLATTNYSVIYTLDGCASNSSSGTVTIEPLPAFTLSGTDPTICNASDGYITIAGLNASTTYTITYNDGSTPVSLNNQTSTVAGTLIITNLNWGDYSNFTITSNGCTGTNPAIITLSNLGGPTLNSPGNQTHCLTYTLPLITGTNLSGMQGYFNNTQALGGTLITGNLTNTQEVWIYDLNNGCSTEISFLVTINTTPTLTVNNPTICAGESINITATPAVNGGTFLWSTAENTQTISVSPTTTNNYTVVYTLFNCPSLPITSTVTITSLPVAAVDNPIICIGDVAIITASSPNAGGTYLWLTGETTSTLSVSPVITTTYTVTYNLNGCASLPVSGIVTVMPIPDPSAGVDKALCSNQAGTIGINSTAGYAYSWSPTTGLSSGTIAMPAIILENNSASAVSSTYTVTVTSPGGCSSVDDVLITVLPIPTSDFTADTLVGCSPLLVTFINTSTTPNSSFVWDFGDGISSANSNDSILHEYTAEGYHDVSLTSTSNGCSFTKTVVDMIHVLKTPRANFSVDKPYTTEFYPNFTFTNNSTDADTYSWNFGDTTFSNAANPAHLYKGTPGEYIVTLIASSDDGCIDTTYRMITIREELLYYIPNSFTPDGDQFNQTFQPVFSSGFDPYKFALLIFNKWGQVIYETHDAKIGWDGSYGGKIVKDGSYVWKLEFRDKYSDKIYMETGFVNVLK